MRVFSSRPGFFDPSLAQHLGESQVSTFSIDPVHARSLLGPDRLVVLACHGEAALGLEGCLVTGSGDRVVDAIALLTHSLTASVVVLEACYSGRYFGARTGEQVNLAIVSLLTGANAAIAGLFVLPADDTCTGRITADLLSALNAGVPAAEALRRARAAYWSLLLHD